MKTFWDKNERVEIWQSPLGDYWKQVNGISYTVTPSQYKYLMQKWRAFHKATAGAMYTVRIHSKPDSDAVKFLGEIRANSIRELKEKAMQHARNANERGVIHLEDQYLEKEWYINVN